MGRYEATKDESDKHMWRVPTWRNVALTAPYFHNGSVKTLDEAVRVMAKTQLNKELSDDDVNAIVAFLHSLTGEFPELTLPRLPQTEDSSLVSSQ
jgi:cytochrome c peroxidase